MRYFNLSSTHRCTPAVPTYHSQDMSDHYISFYSEVLSAICLDLGCYFSFSGSGVMWPCCFLRLLFIFRNPSFLFYLIWFYLAWLCLHLNRKLVNLLSFEICRPVPYCGFLQSSNPVGEFVFSIDYFNGLSFEPKGLWSLLHLSIETALFLAITFFSLHRCAKNIFYRCFCSVWIIKKEFK